MMKKRAHRQLFVRVLSGSRTRGMLVMGSFCVPCALGRSGIRALKREGDGATPRGRWAFEKVYYRADRVARPRTGLRLARLAKSDGWCDAADDRNYNRPVQHPYPASAEEMWRSDHLYDVVCVLNHNARPRVRGLGSAVFMHLARDGYAPTAGCIAVKRSHMLRVLARLRPGDVVVVP
jgi:L,D-peptidoglycan transpeptidase YkuD (ErfK/YbiS/YcfS/YnhG family)